VLHLDHPTLHATNAELPEPWDQTITRYPEYLPHTTIGYDVDEDDVAGIDREVGIRFDRIAVAHDGTWTIFPLTGDDEDDEDDDEGEGGGRWPRLAGFVPFKKKKRKPAPKFTADERKEMADKGWSLDDGSFPIRDGDDGADDLHRAIQALGRAKDRAKAEAHIVKRAKAIGESVPPWIGQAKTAGYRPGVGFLTDEDVHHEARVAAAKHKARELKRKKSRCGSLNEEEDPVGDTVVGDDAVTAAVKGKVKAELKDASGVNSRRGGGKGRSKNPSPFKGKHQRCYAGSPATCASVKWIRMYTALRNKGYSKEKSARISNANYARWRAGIPRPGDRRPMVRKAFP
jgi:hypothetical protein